MGNGWFWSGLGWWIKLGGNLRGGVVREKGKVASWQGSVTKKEVYVIIF